MNPAADHTSRLSADAMARSAGAELVAAGRVSGLAEARTLLAHVLGRRPAELLLAATPTPAQAADFADLVRRRLDGVPVQHLTGRAWFRTVELEVGPGVFVPRPETEAMVGWALTQLQTRDPAAGPAVVVELCAGSGAITKALVAEGPASQWHAVELSADAMRYAERNLSGLDVDLHEGDMADSFPELDGAVDLVIANPPYIPLEAWESVARDVRDHDPALALFSGHDGLDAMRIVAQVAGRLLGPGGVVCAEHAEVQELSAQAVFVETGFEQVRDHRDLTDRPRFVTAMKPQGFVAGWARD